MFLGKFLGYMLSKRGIKLNPDKCQAILEMQILNVIKDIQKLNGWLAALTRFLAKSAKIALPFFKNLEKHKRFSWVEEC